MFNQTLNNLHALMVKKGAIQNQNLNILHALMVKRCFSRAKPKFLNGSKRRHS
jgi:hypothetical protein